MATLAQPHKCEYERKTLVSSPTVSQWGIDMIGEIKPTASNGHFFILIAIDYFTKWVEVASFASVT